MKRKKETGGLNLELALIMALLVLTVVFGLSWMGTEIAVSFSDAADYLISGGKGVQPVLESQTLNPDGTIELSWTGGEGPYQVVIAGLEDMSDGVVIESDITSPYTIKQSDLAEGVNYITIRDIQGDDIEEPLGVGVEIDNVFTTTNYAGWWMAEGIGTWNNYRNNTISTFVGNDGSVTYTHVSVEATSIYFNSSSDWVRIGRAFLPFDTSSIPDNAVISEAQIGLYPETAIPEVNIHVVSMSDPSTTTNYGLSDFGVTSAGFFPANTGAVNTLSYFDLDTTIIPINIVGQTNIALRSENDLYNIEPTTPDESLAARFWRIANMGTDTFRARLKLSYIWIVE